MSRLPPPRPVQPSARRRAGGASSLAVTLGGGLVLVLLFGLWLGARALRPGAPTALPDADATPASAVAARVTVLPTPQATPAAPAAVVAPDIPALQDFMLTLINQERRANGRPALIWDGLAARAGLRHAEEMATFNYLSHRNLDGYGPSSRYAAVGGTLAVRELIHSLNYDPASAPQSQADWEALVARAHQELLAEGAHAAAMLDPSLTAVGIGLAYDQANHLLALDQLYTADLVSVQQLPLQATPGQSVVVAGQLRPGALSAELWLGATPPPAPRTVAELRAGPDAAEPPAPYRRLPLAADADGRFSAEVALDQPGQTVLYTLQVVVVTAQGPVVSGALLVETR